ncbi:hypothetical protein GCK32_015820 [Trichostrongylus colubriformis]|uniref:Uncharacterized protein n=1 Tax=Trichostrongylus colubriformis TaxID=6319 RepID=A0AAN8IUN5_TRICO
MVNIIATGYYFNMSDRPFIRSVYYTAERREQHSESHPQDMTQPINSYSSNPVLAQKIFPHHVPKHYFAPKLMANKPLIESSYCVSAASMNYLMESPKKEAFHRDGEVECTPALSILALPEAHVVQASSTPQRYGEQYHSCERCCKEKTSIMYKESSITTKPLRQIAVPSEYAWKRIDEENRQRYAINLWHEGN